MDDCSCSLLHGVICMRHHDENVEAAHERGKVEGMNLVFDSMIRNLNMFQSGNRIIRDLSDMRKKMLDIKEKSNDAEKK